MANYDAVIFDMDGTLVESPLDFQAIRAELDIGPGQGILEAIEAMGPDRKRRAERQLLAHELACAHRARPVPGAVETVEAVRREGLKTAMLTRNARRPMEIVLAKLGLRFDLAWSRECGAVKPEPEAVLAACRELNVQPRRTVSVGDFRYDIEAANAAGAVSVLLARNHRPAFADQADYVIQELTELLTILKG